MDRLNSKGMDRLKTSLTVHTVGTGCTRNVEGMQIFPPIGIGIPSQISIGVEW